jgi:catalase
VAWTSRSLAVLSAQRSPEQALGDAPRETKIRHISNCLKADPAYGKGVAAALGIPLSDIAK